MTVDLNLTLEPATASTSTVDPITLEILWARLISIVEESESVIVRTSFSPSIAESDDHSSALLDRHGRLLAQTPSAMPAFIGILDNTTRILLEHYPPETLEPGDVLCTNDPWICCGHLNDLNVLRPIFYKGKIVAFTANTADIGDIGGIGTIEARDLYEEGIRILPSKLVRAGVPNEDIFKFFKANSRVPEQVIGDINAMLAGAEMAEKRFIEMLEEYELDDINEISDEIQTRTERAMREAISKLPDGDYFGHVTSDGYPDPIELKVKVTIAGDEVIIDFDGTSPQVPYAVNCPLSLTYAESLWPIRVAIGADIPATNGSLKPITVKAPEGSILNPRFPAPVHQRTTIVHNAQAPIFQALSTLVPEHIHPSRVQANGGCIKGFSMKGTWSEAQKPEWATGARFAFGYLANGGQGGTGATDGHACMSYPDNCANVPIEVVEARSPVLFLRKEITVDSEGAGKFRGGPGQSIDVLVRNDDGLRFGPVCGDKTQHPPAPLAGGQPGGLGHFGVNGESTGLRPVWVNKGDIINFRAPGGGGYGNPLERDPEAVRNDVRKGFITPERARTVYGVDVDDLVAGSTVKEAPMS
jgi:N-methylhydantoinase B